MHARRRFFNFRGQADSSYGAGNSGHQQVRSAAGPFAEAFRRLHPTSWFDERQPYRQGPDEDSATLAAIRQIRALLPAQGAEGRLYYQV
jgi:hypothetical protein